MTPHPPLRLVVLMPLRDDWHSAAELIRRLDKAVSSDACTMEIILVDDGSVQECDRNDFQSGFSAVRAIRTLRLRRNLGHQRAIAIGLVHVYKTASCDAVLVMDADGEDTPEGAEMCIRDSLRPWVAPHTEGATTYSTANSALSGKPGST